MAVATYTSHNSVTPSSTGYDTTLLSQSGRLWPVQRPGLLDLLVALFLSLARGVGRGTYWLDLSREADIIWS